jgi:hypothetical protein
MIYLGIIAEKDKHIEDMKFEHRRELAEKDKIIAYYRKTAEQATDRKQRAIKDAERKAKLTFSYAALIVAAMTVIPWVLWLCDFAAKNFWLWANGR